MALFLSYTSAVLLIALDQFIKWLIVTNYTPGMSTPVWDGVLHITYVQNYGAVFGMGQGSANLLAIVSGVLLLGLAVWMAKRHFHHRIEAICLPLILAGGIGNLIDRLWRGFVVDYIDVRIIRFYVFNFADSLVVCGTILLCLYILFFYKEEPKKESELPDDLL